MAFLSHGSGSVSPSNLASVWASSHSSARSNSPSHKMINDDTDAISLLDTTLLFDLYRLLESRTDVDFGVLFLHGIFMI